MTPQKRELILKVADDQFDALPILYQLEGFVHSERMFKWLIQNGITGKEFIKIYQINFKLSWLGLGKWLVQMVNKDNQIRKVIAGRDYITK